MRPQRQDVQGERHLVRRMPRKNSAFSWGRFPMGDTGFASYRLFYRDSTGALHSSISDFSPGTTREHISEVVWAKRRELFVRAAALESQLKAIAA